MRRPRRQKNANMWINPFARFFIAILFTGCIAGLGGLLLVICLHAIQHIAFGYSLDLIISHVSFYEGVSTASPIRRVTVLLGSGLVAGFGWWMLYHYGKPLVSIGQAIKAKKPYMPVVSTIIHAFLQIITIAMGSPLGREVAPREIGATFSIWFSTRLKLNTNNIRILLACGAGAGLAAVYNVPLGGTLFTLEVLLRTFNRRIVLPALFTSILATLISRLGLGNEHQYQIFDMSLSLSLLAWSLVTGPIFGITAFWFSHIAMIARAKAPHDWCLPLFCCLNFLVLGTLAIYFPALLGNGKSPVQISLIEPLSIELAVILLILRVLITWSSLRAGAQGGLLTPSLANGALLGVVLGYCWSMVWPSASQGAYAVIGATAFLAVSQKMPLTAVVLIFELTGMRFNLFLPVILSVGGAIISIMGIQKLPSWNKRFLKYY